MLKIGRKGKKNRYERYRNAMRNGKGRINIKWAGGSEDAVLKQGIFVRKQKETSLDKWSTTEIRVDPMTTELKTSSKTQANSSIKGVCELCISIYVWI